jgi:hypothetical protein
MIRKFKKGDFQTPSVAEAARLNFVTDMNVSMLRAVAYAGLLTVSTLNGISIAAADDVVRKPVIGENTEKAAAIPNAQAPVSISVDGENVYGNSSIADSQRKADVALADVDIQVKFDGLGVVPILNVSTWPVRRTYKVSEEVKFLASSNYPAWISKSEIRVFERGASLDGKPLYTVPVRSQGDAVWAMPDGGPSELVYVLRVSDDKGHYDETKPLSLSRTTLDVVPHEPQDDAVAPGYSEDRTAFRNIPVYGGAITVAGKNVPPGKDVRVLGDSVPVDADNAFVVQRILPPGDHAIDVAVLDGSGDERGKGLEFTRTVNIPTSEWFYVALADMTVGTRWGSKHIEDVKPGEFDNVYTKGRLAFYVKGKIKGRYLLTAAADTGEDRIQNLFKGLDSKDPKQFLSRINPDDYYPVYGDDSTAVDDAPTRGKFYVRLEKGDSRVMWGNFRTRITGTHFLRNERALYGANAVYRSEKATSFGERKVEASVYAAQPDTLPQRDIFKGTGGSAYFLKHQDITAGSETVTVEVRSPTTGQILSRRSLREGFDYDVDYVQGLIILKAPLSSSVSAGEVVRDGALGGANQFLVVNYEFSPRAGDAKGYSIGGRAQKWFGEVLRLGVTGAKEKTGAADQKLYGADVQVRHSDRTFIEGEVARSEGPGFGNSTSVDGGLTISETPTSGAKGRTAMAYRVNGQIGLEDVTDGRIEGDVGAFYEQKQGGFSSLDDQVNVTRKAWGADGRVKLGEHGEAHIKYEDLQSNDGAVSQELNADVGVKVGEHVTIAPGMKYSNQSTAGGIGTDQGKRADVGAVATYVWDENKSVYVLGQATVSRSGSRKINDRLGIGGEMPISEKVSVNAEVSDGNLGLGGKAGIDYHPTADDHYYIGYKLDPDRSLESTLTGRDLGAIVAGAHHRFNEQFSVFNEDTYDIYGERRALTQTYGVEYTPTAQWNVGGAFETGKITDDSVNSSTGIKNSDFDRVAGSVSLAYHGDEGIDAHAKGEVRFENSDDNTRNRDTYLFSAGLTALTSVDWRLLADVDGVFSSGSTDSLDGKYAEASLGYAYRPVEGDRVNALFKYTFLYDFPGADQVTVNGTTNGPAQLSNILSADVSYDLNKIVTVGAKYGVRVGETRDRSGVGSWEKSSTHLGVLRADFHIVNKWDALLEGRILWNPQTSSTDLGVLAAVYYDIGENFKIGLGYNFGSFSDDLRDLTYDDHGIFLNAVGKF